MLLLVSIFVGDDAERISKHSTHAEGKKSLPVPMGQPRHEEGCMHFPDRQMQRSSTHLAIRHY